MIGVVYFFEWFGNDIVGEHICVKSVKFRVVLRARQWPGEIAMCLVCPEGLHGTGGGVRHGLFEKGALHSVAVNAKTMKTCGLSRVFPDEELCNGFGLKRDYAFVWPEVQQEINRSSGKSELERQGLDENSSDEFVEERKVEVSPRSARQYSSSKASLDPSLTHGSSKWSGLALCQAQTSTCLALPLNTAQPATLIRKIYTAWDPQQSLGPKTARMITHAMLEKHARTAGCPACRG